MFAYLWDSARTVETEALMGPCVTTMLRQRSPLSIAAHTFVLGVYVFPRTRQAQCRWGSFLSPHCLNAQCCETWSQKLWVQILTVPLTNSVMVAGKLQLRTEGVGGVVRSHTQVRTVSQSAC